MKLLLYCTKQKPLLSRVEYLYGDEVKTKYECVSNTKKGNKYLEQMGLGELLNGKIVGECDFEVSPFKISKHIRNIYSILGLEILEKGCLTYQELKDYLQGDDGYAIRIKNLVIYDTPKELREFKVNYHTYDKFYDEPWAWHWVDKAPQNMMYVEDNGVRKILISIRPQWLCKILNGEKTIEVRRKVLKEMV